MTGTMLSTVCRRVSLARSDVQFGRPNLLHHPEAVGIISVENVRTHEGEDRHDVVKYGIRCDPRKACHE